MALLWRLAYLSNAPSELSGVDAREYAVIASTLLDEGRFLTPAHGLPHGQYAVRTPGYPAFLAVVFRAGETWFGSRLALVRPAQVALDLGALLLLGLVGAVAAGLSWRRFTVVFAAIACACLVHVATVAEEGRYNLLVMPQVMVLAAAGLG